MELLYMPSQARIIASVNQLLKRKGLTVEYNNDGVCAGLASIYIKYTLANNEAKFFELTRKLAYPPKDYNIGTDQELDNFMVEVQLAFNPKSYKKDTWQGDLEKVLHIDGKPLQNEYNLGLVTGMKEWASLLEQIHNDGRACYIGSHNHAIALSFQDGQYVIYDPNYEQDSEDKTNNTKRFDGAKDAILELKRQFNYKDNNIGLKVRVFSHPSAQPSHHYPKKSEIHSKYLNDKDAFKRKINVEENTLDSTDFALRANDEQTLDYLHANNAFTLENCYSAIIFNRINIVLKYLNVHRDSDTLLKLIRFTAQAGTSELLTPLLDKYVDIVGHGNTFALEILLLETPSLLTRAINSTNPKNTKVILSFHEKHKIALEPFDKSSYSNILTAATYMGNTQVLEHLVDHYKPIPEIQKIRNIKIAAKKNSDSAIVYWIKNLKSLPAKENVLSDDIIAVISPLNLKRLLDNGFKVNKDSLKTALERKDIDTFLLCLEKQEKTSWTQLITELSQSTSYEKPIDLSQQQDGLSLGFLLIKLKKNQLLKKNWHEGIDDDFKIKLLEYATQVGNLEISTFLNDKKVILNKAFQKNTFDKAIDIGDEKVMDAVLATGYDVFANKNALIHTVYFEKNSALQSLWEKNSDLDSQTKLDTLGYALSLNNKVMIKYIAEEEPLLVIKFLADSAKKAYALKRSSPLKDIETIAFHCNKLDFSSIWKDIKKEDGNILNAVLNVAILNNYFSLADSIHAHHQLGSEECFNLLLRADDKKNVLAIDYLLSQYETLAYSKPYLLTLMKEGRHDLMAKIITINKSIELPIVFEILNDAVEKNNEKIISLLATQNNNSYKVDGSPLYKAIIKGNSQGAYLLLKHGAELDKSMELKLLNLALHDNNKQLIHELQRKLDATEHYITFINYAIEQKDIELYNTLANLIQYQFVDKKSLFLHACLHKSQSISNIILNQKISFANKEQVHDALTQLFGAKSSKELFDIVYENKLGRLYTLMRLYNYPNSRASVFLSVDTLLFDSGISNNTKLRNHLIKRALNENNAQTVDSLLKQLENIPSLDEGGFDLICKSIDKPVIRKTILKHFDINDVISYAVKQKQWTLIAILLNEYDAIDIDNTLITSLKKHDEKLLNAFNEYLCKNLNDDPRKTLNALLIPSNKSALAVIVKNQHKSIEQSIMNIQERMIKERVDLARTHYRFDLRDELISFNQKSVETKKPNESVIDKLINELGDYVSKRSKKANYYHLFSFLQFSKQDKIGAAMSTIDLLSNRNYRLTPEDLNALKQGSLKKKIDAFIQANQNQLMTYFDPKQTQSITINDIDSLINAAKKANSSKSVYTSRQ
jgi:hypothetical protein